MVVLWDADKLLKQLALGEDSRVDFKEVVFRDGRVRERLANELAAFGNTLGGALIFSVSDTGDVRPMTREMMDALEAYVGEICADSIHPPLGFTTQRLALPDGLSAFVVEVERSPLVHRSPGGYLFRQGSSVHELSPEALRCLFQQRGRSGLLGPDEEIVTGTGLNTLESALVDRFISSRTRQADETQLAKLGLMREDDNGVPRASHAGQCPGGGAFDSMMASTRATNSVSVAHTSNSSPISASSSGSAICASSGSTRVDAFTPNFVAACRPSSTRCCSRPSSMPSARPSSNHARVARLKLSPILERKYVPSTFTSSSSTPSRRARRTTHSYTVRRKPASESSATAGSNRA